MNKSNFDWMLTGCHPLSKVALAYLDDYKSASAATRAFRNMVRHSGVLLDELTEAGYVRETSMLCPQQIAIIIQHWGMPNTVRNLIEEHRELKNPKLSFKKRID